MKNHHFAKAIVDIAIFLEFSGEKVIDPDAAIMALEQLADELKKMPAPDRDSLIRCWEGLAVAYGERAEFVRSLPDALGLR